MHSTTALTISEDKKKTYKLQFGGAILWFLCISNLFNMAEGHAKRPAGLKINHHIKLSLLLDRLIGKLAGCADIAPLGAAGYKQTDTQEHQNLNTQPVRRLVE